MTVTLGSNCAKPVVSEIQEAKAFRPRYSRPSSGTGSLSWDLQLVNDQTKRPMTVQLIAIDGIAVPRGRR